MKKRYIYLICLSILLSCTVKKNKASFLTESLIIPKNDYEFWDFSKNGKGSINKNLEWETRNIKFSDSTLISDGIYENSGRFTSEKAFLLDKNNNLSTKSIAISFKFAKKYPKKNNTLPILVKGKYYRCVRILAKENEIIVKVDGNFSFTIPNEDIVMKRIKYNPNVFNTLYLSWNTEKSQFYVALNDNPFQKITIPADFEWHKCGSNFTIQDYSSGSAFKGEINYLLIANDFLNRRSMKNLILKNRK